MTDDLVSVVTPTFNRADCLPRAIDSALSQTHTNLEILVIDDGSTDDTAALVRRRWPQEPRVRYLFQANRGVSAARNLAMSEARGAFVAFLDSDDWWMPWKLKAQLACMAQYPAAVMIHSDLDAVDPAGRVYAPRCLRELLDSYRRFTLNELYSESRLVRDFLEPLPESLADTRVYFGDVYSHMIFGNLMMPSSVILRRDRSGSFGRWDEAQLTEETFDYHLQVCRKGPVAFIDAATYSYQRGREDHNWYPERHAAPDVAHKMNRSYLRSIEALIATDCSRITIPKQLIARHLADVHAWVADTAVQVGNRGEAVRHLARSLRLRPWQPRRTLAFAAAFCLPPALLRRLKAARSALARSN